MTSIAEPPADAPCDLRLRDAALADGSRATVDIRGDRVAALRDPGAPLPPAGRTIDLGGALVLPDLTDGHVHLDKCLLGLPWRPHAAAGSVRAIIDDEKRFRRATRIPLAEQGAEALLERMLTSPGVPASPRSSGVVICCSISSAARPGTWVVTWAVTSLSSGYASIASWVQE